MKIILAATPIGNIEDASTRFCRAVEQADIIAAEDTRKFFDLARRLEIKVSAKVMPMHEHNEQEQAKKIVTQVKDGALLLVVSDAGMPCVSDPGYRLVQIALEAGVEIDVLPGPSAVITAIAISGLPSDRFCFEGFLPRKTGEKHAALAQLAEEKRTLIFFESPRRVAHTLEIMQDIFGNDRSAALCRELTKVYQEVKRDNLANLYQWVNAHEVKGEIVLVVAGKTANTNQAEDYAKRVLQLAAEGMRLKEAASEVAKATGLRPRALYEAALAIKAE